MMPTSWAERETLVSSPQADPPYGFLRACIDKRFVDATRQAFENQVKTDFPNLAFGPTSYWHEAYAGGSAKDPPGFPDGTSDGEKYAVAHDAKIFGWQAHISFCGGFATIPEPEQDVVIREGLARTFDHKKRQYPDFTQYMILAKERADGVDFEITPYYPTPPETERP